LYYLVVGFGGLGGGAIINGPPCARFKLQELGNLSFSISNTRENKRGGGS